MNTVLHISDPHFGTERDEVAQALLALHQAEQPDLVILSGDITQRARRSQFAAARAFVDRLAARALITIPGNHDLPLFNPLARLFYPYANYAREFGSDLEPTHETDTLLVVGVNTTRRWRHVDGQVSASQIKLVAQRLQSATPLQLRIVVTHQPVHVVREQDAENLLHGHQAAVHAWSDAGADIILGGHIHLPYVSPLSDRRGALRRQTWAVQAGTALSTRVRRNAPNSVNVLRYEAIDPQVCVVERWDYDVASAAFQRGATTALDLDRRTTSIPAIESDSQAAALAQPASTSLK